MPKEIRAKLSDDDARALAEAPERGLRSVQWLAAQIIRRWLADPIRSLPPDPPHVDEHAAELAMKIARRREAIVLRWRRYMGTAARSKSSEVATTAFLRRLSPSDRVCRSTLYRWERLHAAHGLAGLIDARLAGAGPTLPELSSQPTKYQPPG